MEPIVYHGYTLTTKILFKDVVATVEQHAFEVRRCLAIIIHKAMALASWLIMSPSVLLPRFVVSQPLMFDVWHLMTGVLVSCYPVTGKPLLPGAAGDPGPLPHFHPGRQTVENASGSECCWNLAQPKCRLNCRKIEGGCLFFLPPWNLWTLFAVYLSERRLSVITKGPFPHKYNTPGHWRWLTTLASLFYVSLRIGPMWHEEVLFLPSRDVLWRWGQLWPLIPVFLSARHWEDGLKDGRVTLLNITQEEEKGSSSSTSSPSPTSVSTEAFLTLTVLEVAPAEISECRSCSPPFLF